MEMSSRLSTKQIEDCIITHLRAKENRYCCFPGMSVTELRKEEVQFVRYLLDD
jgi:hypothetical protein